ncbi:hypothetical protein DNK49_06340 [Azoarcus communis]|uniref:Uncharacterized protein n=1 Tax=Parazoarcus communis SWub3 = DSM 12120 TaxID=1121029 RepID=A0A323V1V7_9RHOO|nr:hypothetical protein [Parazoarcus communis SWub3 = DSM 12120]PZA17476.1 hypothetical protein DNK49_06340 [Azoarcus communis] [Parazoarcus communis SWub3 = DSM 12120]
MVRLVRALFALSATFLCIQQLGAVVLRAFPADAVRAVAKFAGESRVAIDGKLLMLSPGAQIRDANNRIVLPASASGEYKVRVQIDNGGQIRKVWILTPEEIAMPDPKQ